MMSNNNQTIDYFMCNISSEFNKYANKIHSVKFTSKINHMYDINKKKFVNNIKFCDMYIIKKYDIFVKKFVFNKNNEYDNKDPFAFYKSFINKNDHYICPEKLKFICSFCKCDGDFRLIFSIDNYCNIYIPHLKLYIINNYNKYNLYTFYTLRDFFNNKKILIYFNENINDIKLYTSLKNLYNYSNIRNIYLYLPTFLKEIKHNNIIEKISLCDHSNLITHIKTHNESIEHLYKIKNINSKLENRNKKYVECLKSLKNKCVKINNDNKKIVKNYSELKDKYFKIIPRVNDLKKINDAKNDLLQDIKKIYLKIINKQNREIKNIKLKNVRYKL